MITVGSAPTVAEDRAQVKADAGHIALLLPLSAKTFRQPAEAVKQGFQAGAKVQANAPTWRIYSTSADPAEIVAIYMQAVRDGARVVVGPLTKNAILALAAQEAITVPTLALSIPDGEPPANDKLYLFGLSLDAEARQVARLMARAGHRTAVIIGSSGTLSRRIQSQFAEEWRDRGGQVLDTLVPAAAADTAGLRDQLTKRAPDALFIALTAAEARAVRPYLPASLPTYATSQVFSGAAEMQLNVDLAGVRFVDMPWLIQPDHPAVMVYARSETPLGADGERLYALGIDAFRLAHLVMRGPLQSTGVSLDGVTGQLRIGPGRRVVREPLAAEFQADVVLVLDNSAP